MRTKDELLTSQRSWAHRQGLALGSAGYLFRLEDNLYQPLSEAAHSAFSHGSGSELIDSLRRPAKMKALHSSSALVVNVFDYWQGKDLGLLAEALGLEIEFLSLAFERQFPTGLGGIPPNLDVALAVKGGGVLGVESKFSEWLTPKPTRRESLKAKYFPEGEGLWARVGLREAQRLAVAVFQGEERFQYLDVPQLLKHMLGLASSSAGKARLHYLFFDWPGSESSAHQEELARFQGYMARELPFHWGTYQVVFQRLQGIAGYDHEPYLRYLRGRYFSERV